MPAPRNLNIFQGDTYTHQITFVDGDGDVIDLTNYTFTASIETTAGAAVATFSVANGGTTGIVTISLSSATTAGIEPGDYLWDLQGVVSGVTTTYLAGRVRVRGQVT